MDRFRAMESFSRVVRTGSFTRAASQLGLSRAMVSRHIADLESRLGVKLLNRTTRSVHVTDEGARFLAACDSVLRELEKTEQSIARTRTGLVGNLRLTAPKSFGSLHLADAVIAFQQAHPRLQVALTLEDYSFRPYDFIADGIDVAIRLSPIRDSSVIARQVALLDWIVCAAPAYLERHRAPATPAELARHACLVHMNLDQNDHVWRFDGPKGPVSARASGAFQSNSALVLRKAALAGLGVAILPRYCIGGDLAQGTLVRLLRRYRVPKRPIVALFAPADPVPPKIRAFVDFLAQWFARHASAVAAPRPATEPG